MQVIDGDGHVNELARNEELVKYMPKGCRAWQTFPVLDHLHFHYLKPSFGQKEFGNPGPREWLEFLEKTGIDWSVLYPTWGLAMGRLVSMEWAIAACRAYNNWLYDTFLNHSPKLKGVALIPIQDVDAAVEELRRAVTQQGMIGAMLPSNGEGLQNHLGAKLYWPIYEEAEKLNCSLAVHVGALHHLGMDTFSTYYPVHAIGHPMGIMIQAAAMVSHGVFERFPNLRVGFLEGGSTWVPFFLDRLDRSHHEGHMQVDLEGEILGGPKLGEKASDYFRKQMREGRIFVGFDVDDGGLGFAVQNAGRDGFLFGSDFPHEVFDAAKCRHEIDELLAREDLSEEDKEAVLGGNAKRLYQQPEG